LINAIAHFETIATDFNAMSEVQGWGLSWPVNIRYNASERPQDYRQGYKRQLTQQRVAELYAEDLKLFGYQFWPPNAQPRSVGCGEEFRPLGAQQTSITAWHVL
jgi:hypothetical protein